MIKALDFLRRNFQWQGNEIEKGFNLVKWVAVQQNRKNGELRVRNLKLQNKCLLNKWLRRCVYENPALWKEVVHHKYGQVDHWCTNGVISTYGVGEQRTKITGTAKT